MFGINVIKSKVILLPHVGDKSFVIWITTSGSLGEFNLGSSVNVNVFAHSSDATSITYSISAGSLPLGLTLDSISGQIAGTAPALAQITDLTIRATNGDGKFADQAFSLTFLNEAPVWQTSSGSIGEGNSGSPFSAAVYATDPNNYPITYSLTGGTLPPGLTLNSSTGIIDGSLPVIGANVTFSFTVTASDGIYSTPQTFSITVDYDQNNSGSQIVWESAAGSLGTDVQNKYFYATIEAVSYASNAAAITYSLTNGSLPPGLTLDGTLGVISGNLPSVTSDTIYPFEISAFDGFNYSPIEFSITSIVDDTGVDAFANSVVLLMHMDDSDNHSNAIQQNFVDILGHSLTLPDTSYPITDRSVHLFGNASGYFNGAGNIIVTGGSEFDFSNTPFTVEFYALPSVDIIGYVAFITLGNDSATNGSDAGLDLYYDGTANLVASYKNSQGNTVTASFPWAMPYGEWSHIALCCDGTYLTAFASGVLLGTVAINNGFSSDLPLQIVIGSNNYGSYSSGDLPIYFSGMIDEVRITRDVRYTASFSLPTRPWPNIPVWNNSTSTLPNAIGGVSYSGQVLATQADSHVLTYAASGLPSGILVNPSLGLLYGTAPSVSSNTVYSPVFTVSDGYNTVAKTFSLTDEPHQAPYWNTPAGSLGAYVEGGFIDIPLSVTSPQNLPMTISVLSGQLPPGLVLGLFNISGTAPAESSTATFDFTLLLSDGIDTAARDFSMTIEHNQTPVWTSNGIVYTGIQDTSVSFQLQATDPLNQTLTYTVVGGSLPSSLTVDSSGLLHGTLPAVSNNTVYSFTVRAANPGLYADQPLEILDETGIGPSWITTPGNIGQYTADADQVHYIFAGNSNIANVVPTFSVVSGTLPAGLTFVSDNGSGILSGIPSSVTNTTTYDFSVQLSNGQFTNSEDFSITILVNHGIIWNTASQLGTINAGYFYDQSLSATSLDEESLSYVLASGTLPSGIVLANTGVLSGTPVPVSSNSAAAYSFNVTANNAYESNSRTFILSVQSQNPVWVTQAGDIGLIYDNAAYSYNFVATSASPLTYTVSAGSIPAGFTLNSANSIATLSGTATSAVNGTYAFSITASDGVNQVSEAFTATVVLAGTPAFVTTGITPATVDVGYNFQIVATDPNNATLTYSVSSGSLPVGLSLTSSGLITGTPDPIANTTTYNFTVAVTNGMETNNRAFSIEVIATNALVWETSAGIIGNAVATTTFTYQLQISNASVYPVSFSIVSGSFPPTLNFANTGYISGILPSVTTSSLYTFTVDATNTINSIQRAFSINVVSDAPAWTTPSGSIGNVYASNYFSYTLTAVSALGINEITFAIVSGSLPPGLTLVNNGNNTATISGYTPDTTTNLMYTFTVSASNPYITTNRSFSLTVLQSPVAFFYPSGKLNTDLANGTYSSSAIYTNFPSTYAITNGTLPPGISIDASSGDLSGILPSVTYSTTYTFEVTANPTSSGLPNVSRQYSITVVPSAPDVADAYSEYVVFEAHLRTDYTDIFGNQIYYDDTYHPLLSDERSIFNCYSSEMFGYPIWVADTSLFDFSTTDFTVEFWANFRLLPATPAQTLFSNKYFTFYYESGNLVVSVNGSSQNFAWTSDRYYNNFAVVKSSGTITVYVNGSQVGGSFYVGTLTINNTDTNNYFGASGLSGFNGVNSFGGFMAELRITLAARYTSNYSLPTIPVWPDLPVIQNTITLGYGSLTLSEQLIATDPYNFMNNTFSLLGGTLPPGLTLTSGGLISGTYSNPSVDTTYNYQIGVSDGVNTTTKYFSTLVKHYMAPYWDTSAGSLGSITSGYPFSANVVATGQYTITYSLISGSLPSGFTLNASTGVISGTSAVVESNNTYNFTLSASDGVSSTPQSFSITILANYPPVWNTSAGALPSTTGGTYYSQTVSATDPENQTVTYSIANGTLPGGLSLNASTGLISGTVSNPTSNFTASFTLRASNGYTSSTLALSISVTAILAPVITGASYFYLENGDLIYGGPAIPNVLGNTSFSYQIQATDPQGLPLTYNVVSVTGTALPPNTSVSSSGLFSGTPPNPTVYNSSNGEEYYQYSFYITVTNGIATSSPNCRFYISVYVGQTPDINSPNAGSLGTYGIGASVSIPINGSDVYGFPVFYDIASGTLPGGLSINANTGVISGTMGNVVYDTLYNFTVGVTNDVQTATRSYSIFEQAYPAPSWVTPSGSIGSTNESQTFSFTLDAYSVVPLTYSLASGSLPSGLTLYSNGVIYGMVTNPPSTLTYTFGVNAYDGFLTSNRSFSITVDEVIPPVWNYYEISNGIIYQYGSTTPITTNFFDVFNNYETLPTLSVASYVTDYLGLPLTFSTTSTLPDGITLNSNGSITGTVANDNGTGTYTIAIAASNGYFSNTQNWYLKIYYVAPPNWNTPSGSLGYVVGGEPTSITLSTTDPNNLSVTYSLASGTLPIGLSLSSSGIISGTPANPGSNTAYSFVLSATNGVQAATRSFSLTVEANTPPVWSMSGSLGTFVSGAAISNIVVMAISATNDALTYALANATTLPSGLNLLSNGVIYGNTAIVQSNTVYNFAIEAIETDGVNSPVAQNFNLTVLGYSQATFTTPFGSLGNVIGDHNFAYSIGASDPHSLSLTYSIAAGTLPPNLSISSSGMISGTTTNPNANTTYSFTVEVNDGVALPTYGSYSIFVIENLPPIFVDGSSYSNTTTGFATFDHFFTANDTYNQGVTYSIASGTLPSALTLNPSTGEVSGIVGNPSSSGATYSFAIAASNGYVTGTLPASLKVNYYAPPTWNNANVALGTYTNGTPFSLLSTATDPNGGSLTYAVTQGNLPSGLSLNTANGTVSGTFSIVNSVTNSTFYITAYNAHLSTPQQFTITVNQYTAPVWSTAAGSLGSVYGGSSFIVNVVANDVNNVGLTVSYSLVSGSLPANLTLSSAGMISGTAINPSVNTSYNFTIAASNGYTSNNRTFSITVNTTQAPNWVTAANLGTIIPTTSVSFPLMAVDPRGLTVTYLADPNNATNGYTLPAGLVFNAANATIYGSISNPASTGTFNFGVDATNGIASNARTFYATLTRVNAPNFQVSNGLLGTVVGLGICTNVPLEMNFEGTLGLANSSTIIDNQGHTVSVVGSSVSLSNAAVEVGFSSAYFNGGYLTVNPNGSEFNLGSGDFTIEVSINITSFQGASNGFNTAIIQQFNGFNNNYAWSLSYGAPGASTSGFVFKYSTDGTSSNINYVGFGFTASANTWYRVAVVRYGSTLTMYVNGTSIGSTSITNTIYGANTNAQVVIGFDNVGNGARFIGYMDELRVTVGLARYNSNYTPSPYPFKTYTIQNPVAIDPAGYTVTYALSGSIPNGITFNSNTGQFSGVYSNVSNVTTYNFNVTATNAYLVANTGSFSITVQPETAPIWVTPAGSLGSTLAGSTFSNTVTATDSEYGVLYSVSGGSLPSGVTLNATTGVIYGATTNTNGTNVTSSFTLSVSDGYLSNTLNVSILVDYNIPPVFTNITANTVFDVWSGLVFHSNTVTATDPNHANLAITFTGSLPTGLSISNSGVISGTIPQPATYYSNVTASVTATNGISSNTVYFYIGEQQSDTAKWQTPAGLLGNVVENYSFSTSIYATDASYPVTYSIDSGSLPIGLTLNSTTGVISGTASELNTAGNISFVANAYNGLVGNTRTFYFNVALNAPPVWITTTLPAGFSNEVYSNTVVAQDQTGLNQPITYSLVSGTLPPNLTFSNTGVISGTLTTVTNAVTSTFTLQASDIGGTANQTFNLTVMPYISPSWNIVGSLGTVIGGYSFSYMVGATDHEGLGITYSLANGSSLPAGLTLSNATISGIATNPASNTTTNFNLVASDAYGSNTQSFSITVDANLPPIFTNSGLLATIYGGTAVSNVAVHAYDTNNQTVTYALSNSTTLPTALSLNTSTGAITGTASNPVSNTTTNFVISATNGFYTSYQNYSIVVDQTLAPVFVTSAGSLGTFNSNTAVSVTVQATDPQGDAITFALASGTLPNGLTAVTNGSNYVISGTTTNLSTANTSTFVLTATNGIATGTRTFSITVNAVPVPTWVTPAGSLGTVLGGRTFANTVTATDPGYTVTYALTSGTLPSALSLNTANGYISGTVINPNSVQNATNFTITASDGYTTAAEAFSIQVVYNQPPIINTAAGSLGTIYGGMFFSNTISAYDPTGYNQTLTYAVASGSLPSGISLNTGTGTISGTATNPASNTTSNFTISVTDAGGSSTQSYSIIVLKVTAPTWVTSSNLGTYYQLQTVSTNLVATDNNNMTLTYVLANSTTLPAGLSLSTSGAITGSISNTATTGIDTFIVNAFDSVSNASQTFTLNVVAYQAPVWSTASGVLVTGAANSSVNTTVLATSPEGFTITYSVYSGTLPGTLSLSSSTGQITGSLPATAGTYSVFLGASDSYTTTTRSFSFVATSSGPVWVTTSLPSGQGNVPYSTTLVATGATSYTIVSGSLPSGLTLNSSTGVISGTPANIIGGYSTSFTVQATGTSGSTNQSFVLFIAQFSNSNYDPYSEAVVLSMPMTGGTSGSNSGVAFQDYIGHTVNVVGSPYVNTVTTYNGLGEVPAVYFPAGSYFSIPVSEEFIFNTNDYTIEWSVIGNQAGTNLAFTDIAVWNNANIILQMSPTQLLVAPFGTTTPVAVLTLNTSSVTNGWFNYAIVKHGSTISLYVNGNLATTTTSTTCATLATPSYVLIGASIGGSTGAACIMNFRVTNGAARYNGAYTVPTSLPSYPTFAAQQNTLLGTFVNNAFGSANVAVSGYNITYAADGLPVGMTINSTTGVISGTPTNYSSLGSTQLITTVTVQDGYLNYQTRNFLIAVDAPPVADTNGGNTIFLMHTNGANSANVFSESLGHTIVPVSGNPSTSSIFAGGLRPFGGSSLYLNGSSAVQAAPFGNEFNLGYNDFTIEFDIYMTVLPSASYPLGLTTFNTNTGTPTSGWGFGILNSTTLAFTYSATGSSTTNLSFTTSTLVVYTWYNFCAVRKNGVLTVYVNGTSLGLSQSLPSIAPYNGNLVIGISNNVYLSGSMSEIRITNGYARYSGASYQIPQAQFANPIYWPTNAAISGLNNNPVNISVIPTEPYGATFSALAFSGLPSGLSASNGVITGTLSSLTTDASYQVTATATSVFSSTQKTFVFTNYATPVVDNYASNVTCFMQFDGLNNSNTTNLLYNPSFVERTGNVSNVQAVGNPTIISSPPGTGNQYSSAALYLNGSSGLNLTANSSAAFTFGSKDFTIEFNVNFATVASCTFICSASSSSTLSWTVSYVSGTGLQFGYSTNGTSFTTVSGSWTPSATTWYQIGVVNKAGSLYLFVNGSQVGSTGTISGTLFTVTTAQIGYTLSSGTAASFITGYISGVRITNGFGRYTTTYTTAEYPPPVAWTTHAGSLTTIIGGNTL